MAFNKAVFKTRALTAVVFVLVMAAGIFINHWTFFLLFSIIHFGCWWEYLKLAEKIHNAVFHPYTKLGFMLIGYGLMLYFCGPLYKISDYGFRENISLPVSAAGFVLLVIGIFQKTSVKMNAFGMALAGLGYISLTWGLLMDLNEAEFNNPAIRYDGDLVYHVFLPVFIIGCMWINDTMAYIVGSLIGKTPLSKISPKKTWEGTVGGMILAAAVMGYIGFMIDEWFVFGKSIYHWIGLALVAVIAGTLGDLLESKLKRMAGVKDSGTLMPGHGGFLDRFDSLLLATPFVWLYVKLLIE